MLRSGRIDTHILVGPPDKPVSATRAMYGPPGKRVHTHVKPPARNCHTVKRDNNGSQARLALVEHMMSQLPLDPAMDRAHVAASLAAETEGHSREPRRLCPLVYTLLAGCVALSRVALRRC